MEEKFVAVVLALGVLAPVAADAPQLGKRPG